MPTIPESGSTHSAALGDGTRRRFSFDTPQTKNDQQAPAVVQDSLTVDYTKLRANNERLANDFIFNDFSFNDFNFNDERHSPITATHQQSEASQRNPLPPRSPPDEGKVMMSEISRGYNVVVMGEASCGKTQFIL